jgi:hypothetical protein
VKNVIFFARFRANSVRKLRRLLAVESVRVLTAPQSFFRFFAPMAFVELLLMRMTKSQAFRRFGSTIVMVARGARTLELRFIWLAQNDLGEFPSFCPLDNFPPQSAFAAR